MFNDIIPITPKEKLEVKTENSFRFLSNALVFLKTEGDSTFNTEGLIGYSILKNQPIFIEVLTEEKVPNGFFGSKVIQKTKQEFSHLETLYVYFRKPLSGGFPSRFVSNIFIGDLYETQ